MAEVIKRFEDGTVITRGQGRIDDWYIEVNGRGPEDKDYFGELKQLADIYGNIKVYNDFIAVYNSTQFQVDDTVFNQLIPDIASTYNPDDNLKVRILFSTLYAVMLAEQNRPLPLKKRVKLLAAYQILIQNNSVYDACNFSKKENREAIIIELHNLICTQSNNNYYCQDINNCVHRSEERFYKLVSSLCNHYGF